VLQDDALQQIQSLVPLVDWKTALKVWSLFVDFPHTVAVPTAVRSQSELLAADELNVVSSSTSTVQQFCHDCSKDRNTATQNSLHAVQTTSHNENCSVDQVVDKDPTCSEAPVSVGGPCLPSFRATCYRTGEHHCFQSPAAAAHFGGAIHDYFGWNVNLSNYDIEVVLCIDNRDVRVGISLTSQSLHRRHITHFGKTTLRPTIAHGMLR